jgi:hypothetical protein
VASADGIAATTRAFLGTLEEACPRQRFPGPLAFTPVHPSVYADTRMQPEGITLCLYRVAASTARRNLPPRLTPEGRRMKPSLPLDLHYLLTPWAASPETQQRLLAWALRQMEDTPVLVPAQLNRYLRAADVFREDEAVEIVADPLSMADFVSVWDKLKPQYQASMTYVARMVLIDSDQFVSEGPPVRTREFEYAKGPR